MSIYVMMVKYNLHTYLYIYVYICIVYYCVRTMSHCPAHVVMHCKLPRVPTKDGTESSLAIERQTQRQSDPGADVTI